MLNLIYLITLTLITTSFISANTKLERRLGFDPSKVSVTNAMTRPDMNEVMTGAWYASAATCDKKLLTSWSCKSCKKVPNTKFYTSFSNFLAGTFGYIALDDDEKSIILVFRGSKNLANYISNINAVPVPFPSAAQSGIAVHAGFLGSMESLSSSFLGALKSLLAKAEYTQYKIKIMGHSLGGAMASLAAIKIKASLNVPFSRLSLFTYGQPRTGNSKYATWFDAQPITSARVVNNNDIVPHLPPSSLNFAHHNNELFINSQNKTSYCNPTVLEDGKCSYNAPEPYSSNAHLYYFNTFMGEDNSC